MPFVLLVALAFALAMVFNKRASRGTYVALIVVAAAATWYYMR